MPRKKQCARKELYDASDEQVAEGKEDLIEIAENGGVGGRETLVVLSHQDEEDVGEEQAAGEVGDDYDGSGHGVGLFPPNLPNLVSDVSVVLVVTGRVKDKHVTPAAGIVVGAKCSLAWHEVD